MLLFPVVSFRLRTCDKNKFWQFFFLSAPFQWREIDTDICPITFASHLTKSRMILGQSESFRRVLIILDLVVPQQQVLDRNNENDISSNHIYSTNSYQCNRRSYQKKINPNWEFCLENISSSYHLSIVFHIGSIEEAETSTHIFKIVFKAFHEDIAYQMSLPITTTNELFWSLLYKKFFASNRIRKVTFVD